MFEKLPVSCEKGSSGLDAQTQRALAAIRTDLDCFSENECHALMFAGYRIADRDFAESAIVEASARSAPRANWKFLRVAGRAHRLNRSKSIFRRTAMWATLILSLATTFKAPACLDIVARHVGTGTTAAFQTLTARRSTRSKKCVARGSPRPTSLCPRCPASTVAIRTPNHTKLKGRMRETHKFKHLLCAIRRLARVRTCRQDLPGSCGF